MKPPKEKHDGRLMRQMFGTIAPRYDFITHAFSYGMDRRWKKFGAQQARLAEAALVLDLACGTGDFSCIVLQSIPRATVVAADLTQQMLCRARQRGRIQTVCANALKLPFPDGMFDGVFVGYGLRNFPDLNAAVKEVHRVTRPGGSLVTLDFFVPTNALWRRLYLGYLYAQGAFWGTLLHGRPRIYTYIPDSLRSFVSIEEFCSLLRRAGYADIGARSFILGGIGVHWGVRS